jgi:hypothetical protein
MLPFRGMKPLPKILLALTAVACTSLFSVQPAQAVPFTMTLQQVGANVVANGSGAFNLTGLIFNGSTNASSAINPSIGAIQTGAPGFIDVWSGFTTGPTSFGSGNLSVANTASGDLVGSVPTFGGNLFVPQGYLTGDLSSSATWNNASFASLGLTPGTYVWTWGNGLPNQSFTLVIGGSVPDGGSTVSLLGCALLGLAALRRKLSC